MDTGAGGEALGRCREGRKEKIGLASFTRGCQTGRRDGSLSVGSPGPRGGERVLGP